MAELVGQPGRKLGWWPVVIWQCYCKQDKGVDGMTLVILNGVNTPSMCPHCQKSYKVGGFTLDPLTGPISPVIEAFIEVKPNLA